MSKLIALISIIVRKNMKVTILLTAIFAITLGLNYNGVVELQRIFAGVETRFVYAEDIKDPAKYFKSFHSAESEKVIMFKKPAPESVPFDIIIIHICSLSWDDLKEIGMTQEDPFFKQFDYLFTNFNSATGYSGPAVTRLLNSNCGQKPHDELLKKTPDKACLLIDSLSSVGYETYLSMNHDGKYGDFTKNIKKNVSTDTKFLYPENLNPSATFFDEKTSLFDDYAMLKRWFDLRQASNAKMTSLYYNTITMHAGSHWVGEKKWFDRDTHEQYKDVLSALLKDLNKFIELIKSSKRNTVLIFISEHGRALTGTAFQAADLRDIPLPKITKVPVGIKFIGPKFNDASVKQYLITKPTSYIAVSWVLSDFIKKSPFGNTAESPDDIVFKIPETKYVSEHKGRIIEEIDGSYLYYGKNRKWITLTPEQLK